MEKTDPRADRVAKALANPIFFGEMYVRPYDEGWVAALPEFAHEMASFALRVRRGVVILPPEFLKTTILSAGDSPVADVPLLMGGEAAAGDAAE